MSALTFFDVLAYSEPSTPVDFVRVSGVSNTLELLLQRVVGHPPPMLPGLAQGRMLRRSPSTDRKLPYMSAVDLYWQFFGGDKDVGVPPGVVLAAFSNPHVGLAQLAVEMFVPVPPESPVPVPDDHVDIQIDDLAREFYCIACAASELPTDMYPPAMAGWEVAWLHSKMVHPITGSLAMSLSLGDIFEPLFKQVCF